MKNFFLAMVGFFVLTSCVQKYVVNRQVDTTTDGKMLLGPQTRSQFAQDPFKSWFDYGYKEYTPDAASIELLKKAKLNSYKITVFLGTWCSDSHREFPKLMKILDALKYPESKLTIIGVNRKKETPSGDESQFNIKRVPTIIVSKYGKEKGRIIESTKSGFIEKDLLEILNKP